MQCVTTKESYHLLSGSGVGGTTPEHCTSRGRDTQTSLEVLTAEQFLTFRYGVWKWRKTASDIHRKLVCHFY
jgi:hypothetical protein